MQINLKAVQREREHLTDQCRSLKRAIQELDERKRELNRQESTRAFAAVLTKRQEELYGQAKGMERMGRVLDEILYCYRESEERIVQEYEQERMELPRFSVDSVTFAEHVLEDMDIHISY